MSAESSIIVAISFDDDEQEAVLLPDGCRKRSVLARAKEVCQWLCGPTWVMFRQKYKRAITKEFRIVL